MLDIHATLENLGHAVPLLNDALHGLTHLGETLGLGHLGQGGNLLTDVAALPGDLLGGQGLGALSPILNDVGAVTRAAGGLLGGVTGPPRRARRRYRSARRQPARPRDLGGGWPARRARRNAPRRVARRVSPVEARRMGSATLLGPNAPLQPVAGLANGAIDAIHGVLEQAGHDVAILNAPLHAVIDLGTDVGLGELGSRPTS